MENLYKEFTGSGRDMTLPEFSLKYKQAKALIDYLTFGRINYNDPDLKRLFEECVLSLISFDFDRRKRLDEAYRTDGIKSETVGSQKIDYAVATFDDFEKLMMSKDSHYFGIVKRYFGLTGLMYRGV